MYSAESSVGGRITVAVVAGAISALALSGCSALQGEEKPATTQCFESELGVPSSSGEPSKDFRQAILNSIYQVERHDYKSAHPHGPKFEGPNWDIYHNATDASVDISKQVHDQASNSTVKDNAPFWYCIDGYKNAAGKINKKVIRAATVKDVQRDNLKLDK